VRETYRYGKRTGSRGDLHQSARRPTIGRETNPNPHLTITESPIKKKSRPKDEAFEEFCAEFQEHREIQYDRKRKGDHVQLANLRGRLDIETKGSPKNWSTALKNYFTSERSTFTLADLCTRYDTFRKTPVDRFGQPQGRRNGNNRTTEERDAANLRAAGITLVPSA
jgi:hypothetical protein